MERRKTAIGVRSFRAAHCAASNASAAHTMKTPPASVPVQDRRALRAALRAKRRAITPAERADASRRVARHIDRWLCLRAGWRIAAYAALADELDSAPLLEIARLRGCRIYLPRIDRSRLGRKMQFIEASGPYRLNRLGIAEPQGSRSIGARWLDVVFLPLLGFDRRGVRLGTGGGFYDRAFAFRRWRTCWHKPLLVGIGYAIQEVPEIVAAPHDVLLDAVVTEEGVITCATGS